MKSFYISTAIYYPNARPHIGHVYEMLLADCYVRWYRDVKGVSSYFLTGTDENGQKLLRAAKEAGYEDPHVFVDKNVAEFKDMAVKLGLSHDDFIRTSEGRHHSVCQKIWQKLAENDAIYLDRYQGHYCIHCEAFYSDGQLSEDKTCPQHGSALEWMEEEGYFFRLSKYRDFLIKHYEAHPQFLVPSSAKSEMLSRLKEEGLKDIAISRLNQGWGIPVPGNDKFVMYTWFDALINYYSAVVDTPSEKFWPCDVHLIGKDITWFHAVIWPAILEAASIPLCKQVYVHGMLLGEDGRKMSKSLGNVVDPLPIVRDFPMDALRYYLMRFVGSGSDGRFSQKELIDRYHSDLANDLGNLLSRVTKLAKKRLVSSPVLTLNTALIDDLFDWKSTDDEISKLMDDRLHNRALEKIFETIQIMNIFLNKHEPWRIKEEDPCIKILRPCLAGLWVCAHWLAAFIPSASAKMKAVFKAADILPADNVGDRFLKGESIELELDVPENLFPRLLLETPE